MKDKIAFVCQRYGLEVNGGAELYCRQLAEKLAGFYNVEVFTTCAVDHITWDNYYSEGDTKINGIIVHRFSVERGRDGNAMGKVQDRVFFAADHTNEEEWEWINGQGPVCDALVDTIDKKHAEFKAIIFMTYLYYPTIKGLLLHLDNTLFIPTLHDEAPVYMRLFDEVFLAPKGFIWNTPEEKMFAEKRFPEIKGISGIYAGIGVNVPNGNFEKCPIELKGKPYIVYAGRIEEHKGCKDLFDYFHRYKKQYGGNLHLALIGKATIEIPKEDDVIYLGFVSDEVKFSVIRNSKVLVLFSKFESLSMVVLESMTMGRPVLVNGQCEVLKGHCIRSNAGLYFENYPEFAATLNYLLSHDAEYAVMCENGKKYVEENYQWDVIVKRICGLIDQK